MPNLGEVGKDGKEGFVGFSVQVYNSDACTLFNYNQFFNYLPL